MNAPSVTNAAPDAEALPSPADRAGGVASPGAEAATPRADVVDAAPAPAGAVPETPGPLSTPDYADDDDDAATPAEPSAPAAAPPRPAFADAPEIVYEARRSWTAIDWAELWRHRELLYFLVWRDVKVRYKQAVLGFAWAILAPLIGVMILSVVFGHAGGFKASLPEYLRGAYALYVFPGLIAWQIIAASIGQGGLSLVNQQNLLSKIYMPRLFIPTSVVLAAMVDCAIAFGVFGLMVLYFGITPAWTIVFVPVLIGLAVLAGLACALTLSALTITYRDVRFLIPFMVQLLMLLSAVAYPVQALADRPLLLYLNPFAGIIGAVRAAVFREVTLNWGHLALATAMTLALLVFGLFYFRKTERRFADIA